MKLLTIVLIAVLGSGLFAGEWHVEKNKKNLVKFTSDAVVLTFHGTTDAVDGYIYWEGEKMFESKSQLQFEVDLGSISTGNGKRDRDMREVVLDTEKYPTTSFKGTIVEHSKIDSNVTAYKIKAKGIINIHGQDKEIEIPGIITIENGKMHVTAKFSVYLKDYGIKAPSLIAFVKVSEEIRLSLDLYMIDASKK